MGKVILTIEVSEENTFSEFIEIFNNLGLCNRYKMCQIPLPVYSFRDDFIEHYVEHGLSSLLNFTIVMEDITSPSMSVDDIENTIKKFISKLAPTKKLIVIDPYFYSENTSKNTHELFSRLITPLLSDLKELIIISNNSNGPMRSLMHSAINHLSSTIQIQDYQTNVFHDRFWINPLENKGIVIGTSLNGIGKKIALVDKISENDVLEIISQIAGLGISM